ncbi:hypothetical protein ABPG72_020532 [Tetrahymena utriculariae]
MRRQHYSLHKPTSYSQRATNQTEKILEFLLKIKKIKLDIELFSEYSKKKKCLFINMDEVPVFVCRCGLLSNLQQKRRKKRDKQRFTAVFTILSNGYKSLPLLIFKKQKGKTMNHFPKKLLVYTNTKGQMNTDICKDYLTNIIFNMEITENEIPILIWDQFKTHKSQEIEDEFKELQKKSNSTYLKQLIPSCSTGLQQPLDVSFNKQFKQKYRELFNDWINADGLSDQNKTKSGYYKTPSDYLIQKWVIDAFEHVPSDQIQKLFKTCGINIKNNNSDVHLLNKNLQNKQAIEKQLINYLQQDDIFLEKYSDYCDCDEIQEQLKESAILEKVSEKKEDVEYFDDDDDDLETEEEEVAKKTMNKRQF